MAVTKLWIGGTSGLARTYFHAFVHSKDDDNDNDDSNHPPPPTDKASTQKTSAAAANKNNDIDQASNWLVLGLEGTKPTWLPSETTYVACDLTSVTFSTKQQAKEFWIRYGHDVPGVNQIVVSVRPPLVSPFHQKALSHYVSRMLTGLEFLLEAVLASSRQQQHDHHGVQHIVHISSIAAVDHLRRQCLWSESDPDPDCGELDQPYDRFKRASEQMLEKLVQNQQQQPHIIEYTSLRLGAIFSDTPTCIQCTALALQARIGPYMELPIDCNSARNASCLIRCILQRQPEQQRSDHRQQQLYPKTLRPIYYYTRPLHYPDPVPYGEYLVAYRQAHDMRLVWSIPPVLVRALVAAVHWWSQTVVGPWIPFLQSMDYLLQVTKDEHSFTSQAVRHDFPQLMAQEETITACFQRRRQQLRPNANHAPKRLKQKNV